MTQPRVEVKPATPLSQEGMGHQRRRWLRRFSAVELLIAIVLLIVASPFVGQSVDAVLMTIVLLSTVLAIGERVRTLRLAALLVTPVVVARWLHHFPPAS
jgi:uncharacterized membrane protein YdbT with pleckstrin-like domain